MSKISGYESNPSLIKKVRAERLKRFLSIRMLSEECGISFGNLAKMEKNTDHRMTEITQLKLLEWLKKVNK